MTSKTPLYQLAGGEDAIRSVVADFYDRVFADIMIGFLFAGQDKARLVARETELALQQLGHPDSVYTGRDLRAAHARHPIMGGHFDRRAQILKETIEAHDLPEAVGRSWLEHTQALRSQITGDAQGTCDDEAAWMKGRDPKG